MFDVIQYKREKDGEPVARAAPFKYAKLLFGNNDCPSAFGARLTGERLFRYQFEPNFGIFGTSVKETVECVLKFFGYWPARTGVYLDAIH